MADELKPPDFVWEWNTACGCFTQTEESKRLVNEWLHRHAPVSPSAPAVTRKPDFKTIDAVAEAIAMAATSHFGDDTPYAQQDERTKMVRRCEARAAINTYNRLGLFRAPAPQDNRELARRILAAVHNSNQMDLDAAAKVIAEWRGELKNDADRLEAVYAAFLGISVLRTMCKKAGLTLAVKRSEDLMRELDKAFPGLSGLSALRGVPLRAPPGERQREG